jgi:hypothetical protein
MAAKTENKTPTPESQLRSFVDRFDPKIQKLFRAVRTAVRELFPTANELAYDYGSHVVISYCPTEQAIESIAAIDGRADGVRLYLMNVPPSKDPKKLLQGTGKQARYVPVEAVSRLAHPDVKALIAASVQQAKIPLQSNGEGRLIIKSDGAKKRPKPKAKK